MDVVTMNVDEPDEMNMICSCCVVAEVRSEECVGEG